MEWIPQGGDKKTMISFPLLLGKFTHNQGVIREENEELENIVAGVCTWQGMFLYTDKMKMDILAIKYIGKYIICHDLLGVSKKYKLVAFVGEQIGM